MIVEHEGYLIEQSDDSPEASVYRNDRKIMHLSLTRFLDPEELIALLKECIRIAGLRRQDEMDECGDYIYDGEEPC